MRAFAGFDPREEIAVRCIKDINLAVIAAGEPQCFSIGRDAAHVRAATARYTHFVDDFRVARSITETEPSPRFEMYMIFHVAAEIYAMRAFAGLDEIDLAKCVSVNDVNTVCVHVCHVEDFSVGGEPTILGHSFGLKAQIRLEYCFRRYIQL